MKSRQMKPIAMLALSAPKTQGRTLHTSSCESPRTNIQSSIDSGHEIVTKLAMNRITPDAIV